MNNCNILANERNIRKPVTIPNYFVVSTSPENSLHNRMIVLILYLLKCFALYNIINIYL